MLIYYWQTMFIRIHIILHIIQYVISCQFFKKTYRWYMLEKLVCNYFFNVSNLFYVVVLQFLFFIELQLLLENI